MSLMSSKMRLKLKLMSCGWSLVEDDECGMVGARDVKAEESGNK